MSNYLRTTKHPKTGNWETAHWLDDHFGPHQYGVKFEDGTIIAPDFQKGYPETRDDKPEKDWDWQGRKEPELTAPVPPEGCTCASFWTVRGTHKKDCPLSPTPQNDELRAAIGWTDIKKREIAVRDLLAAEKKKLLEGMRDEWAKWLALPEDDQKAKVLISDVVNHFEVELEKYS